MDYLDGHGEPQTVVNGICLHEEDDSILWKHVNTRTGSAEVRRSRRLVVSSFATVALLTSVPGCASTSGNSCSTDPASCVPSRFIVRSYAELLPESMRQVIELDILEGADAKEIAQRLGMTPGGVRSIKTRALRRLRDILEKEAETLEKRRRP